MSVRGRGFGVSSYCLIALWLNGCAVSAITGDEDDADLSLTRDPQAFDDAGEDAEVASEVDGGSVVSPDAGRAYAGLDAGARPDAGANTKPDAGKPPVDAGAETLPLTIDGTLNDSEWSGATWTMQSTQSDWGSKNTLSALGVVVKDGSLWIAVRGTIESTNAIVVYLDSAANVGVLPSAITDQTGSLDDALSAALTVPTTFKADLAWGTRSMGVSALNGFNAGTGFRSLTEASVSNLSWLDGTEAPSVCGMNACEARIPLSSLGTGSNVSLFARITNAAGTAFPNQTLPADAATAPANVTQLLTISR